MSEGSTMPEKPKILSAKEVEKAKAGTLEYALVATDIWPLVDALAKALKATGLSSHGDFYAIVRDCVYDDDVPLMDSLRDQGWLPDA